MISPGAVLSQFSVNIMPHVTLPKKRSSDTSLHSKSPNRFVRLFKLKFSLSLFINILILLGLSRFMNKFNFGMKVKKWKDYSKFWLWIKTCAWCKNFKVERCILLKIWLDITCIVSQCLHLNFNPIPHSNFLPMDTWEYSRCFTKYCGLCSFNKRPKLSSFRLTPDPG